jgi:hypothetical protein
MIADPVLGSKTLMTLAQLCSLWAPECNNDSQNLALCIFRSIRAGEFDDLGNVQPDSTNRSSVGVVKAEAWGGFTLDGSCSPIGGLIYFMTSNKIFDYITKELEQFYKPPVDLEDDRVFQWNASRIVLTRAAIIGYASQRRLPIPSWWDAENPKYTKPVVVNFSSGISSAAAAIPAPPAAPEVGWNQNTGFAGRPSKCKGLLREEMLSRAREGRLCRSLAEEARSLCAWLALNYPDAPRPKQKTVENNFRLEFWELLGSFRHE